MKIGKAATLGDALGTEVIDEAGLAELTAHYLAMVHGGVYVPPPPPTPYGPPPPPAPVGTRLAAPPDVATQTTQLINAIPQSFTDLVHTAEYYADTAVYVARLAAVEAIEEFENPKEYVSNQFESVLRPTEPPPVRHP